MARYAAILRGIRQDPNMRNEKLRQVCLDLGFENVATVINSGNIIFDANTNSVRQLESTLEKAWREKLGFESTTIIRTRHDLEKLNKREPFGKLEHSPETYLLVTFFKDAVELGFKLPYRPHGRTYRIIGATDREVFSVTDMTATGDPNVMAWLDNQFGKGISSRTWLTVTRILKRMG